MTVENILRSIAALTTKLLLSLTGLLLVAMAAFELVIAYDFQTINSLGQVTIFKGGEPIHLGWAEFYHLAMQELFAKGKILSLIKLTPGNPTIAIAVVTLFSLVVLDLLSKPTTITKRAAAVVFLIIGITAQTTGTPTLSRLGNVAYTDFQLRYEFVYWGAVDSFLDISVWSVLTWLVLGIIFVYCILKSYIITSDAYTGMLRQDLKKLITGCFLACFAPYRLSQSFEATQDQELLFLQNQVRANLLKRIGVNADNIYTLNVILSKDSTGLLCLVDASSSYILSLIKSTK